MKTIVLSEKDRATVRSYLVHIMASLRIKAQEDIDWPDGKDCKQYLAAASDLSRILLKFSKDRKKKKQLNLPESI